jgi:hypothetical protein
MPGTFHASRGNRTRYLHPPRMFQYNDSRGIRIDVTTISATCRGVREVRASRLAQNRAVSPPQTVAATTAIQG